LGTKKGMLDCRVGRKLRGVNTSEHMEERLKDSKKEIANQGASKGGMGAFVRG